MKARKASNGFCRLDHDIIRTAAWQALSPLEMAVLIHLWAKHNGRNNGLIPCGRREVAERFHCRAQHATQALRGLADKGFIALVAKGVFQRKSGFARAALWRLTMEPVNGADPTRDYLAWQP
jgi:hypothetical protein